jgi:hypothetical protein
MKESSIRIVKILIVVFMTISLFCAAVLSLTTSARQSPGALIQSFLPFSTNFILLISGLISFAAALVCISLYTNRDASAQQAMTKAAHMRGEIERKRYNAEIGQPPEYTAERSDLVTQGNYYLKIWTLYTACVVIAFFVIWSQTMTQSPAAQYTLAGLVIALLPAIYIQIRFSRIARMVAGHRGTTGISMFTFLATGRGRGSGPFGVAITIFLLLGMAVLVTTSWYHISVYALFTAYLPLIILIVLATLGITYALLRLRDNDTERLGY